MMCLHTESRESTVFRSIGECTVLHWDICSKSWVKAVYNLITHPPLPLNLSTRYPLSTNCHLLRNVMIHCRHPESVRHQDRCPSKWLPCLTGNSCVYLDYHFLLGSLTKVRLTSSLGGNGEHFNHFSVQRDTVQLNSLSARPGTKNRGKNHVANINNNNGLI